MMVSVDGSNLHEVAAWRHFWSFCFGRTNSQFHCLHNQTTILQGAEQLHLLLRTHHTISTSASQ